VLRKTFFSLTVPLAISLVLIASSASAWARPMPNRDAPCSELAGLELARCERHRELQAVCGAVPGNARAHCDRCFIAVNTIPCERYAGTERRQCEAEVDAMPACSDGPVEAFMPCLSRALSASPAAVTAQR
jgi:hypothetical protein